MLNTPFTSLVTRGCLPTGTPSTVVCTDEIADQYAFTELYWYLSLYSEARKLATSLTGPETGSVPRSPHQRCHLPKSDVGAVCDS